MARNFYRINALRPLVLRAARAVLALVLVLHVPIAFAAGHSLRFFGAGSGGIDRVNIQIDDPGTALPGPPADVGATDFTLEFWLKASAAENTAGAIACGPNNDWIAGNFVVDRDRLSNDRKFGISIAGGKVVFGVSGDGTGVYSLCSLSSVLDGAWHHVAAERRRSDGFLWLFVDGILEAQVAGPGGDISYPDAATAVNSSEPYLVLGAEKFDRGGALGLAYSGWLDELRISTKLRYAGNFSPPRAPFVSDRFTAALYHFDEGNGGTLFDTAGAFGGSAPGQIKRGGTANGPAWMPDSPFNVGGLVNNATISFVPFVAGFSSPVDLVNAGDGSGRLYVVEQTGLIRIIRNGFALTTPFLDLTAKRACCGEQGLLGLAFHPNYGANGFFYVYYTAAGNGTLTIERYQRDANNTNLADPASAKTMLTIPHPGQTNHNAGKLAFGHDGYLYASIGDGGGGNDTPNNAQNLSRRLGKMLRLDVDQNVNVSPYYGIPATNPYALNACDGVSVGICPEIWASGLRNPWRFTFDRLTGDLFIGDVGQNDREEVDFDPWPGTPARNYGWRIMEGNICTPGVNPFCTPPPGYVAPIFDYPHPPGVAVIGGYRYRGSAVPALAGAYLYADEGSRLLWAATRADTGAWTAQQQLMGTPTAISAFGEDEAGELYAVGLGNGTIYRLLGTDSDSDGLPNWWEFAYFGSTTAATIGADPDGDGATNLQEYQGATDPLSAASKPLVPPPVAKVAVWRPSTARFFIDVDLDRTVDERVYFGATTDKPLVGRIDPGRTYDLVLYRNGLWYADRDRNGIPVFTSAFGGLASDVPLLADFNGDGRDDLVIYRNGTWYVSTAQNGALGMTFYLGGAGGDIPLAGDVNGDGIADLAIYRNGIWYIDTNRNGTVDLTIAFGAPGDFPLLFDFDGDGRADLCVVRNGVWYVNTKLDGSLQSIWPYGVGTDIPLAWKE